MGPFMTPHVYQIDKMMIVPETDCCAYLRLKRQKENRLAVVRKNGRRIGMYPVTLLNSLWGRGWFHGAVERRRLRVLILLIPIGRFFWEIEKVTGEPPPGREERERWTRLYVRKYCARCGKDKDLGEFPGAPLRFADAIGYGAVCTSCIAGDHRRTASTNGEIRRVRERYAPGSHTDEEWQSLLERFGQRCLRCGSTDDLTKDHVVPLSKGGAHSIDNLQPLCRSCNSWKHTRGIDFRDHSIEKTSLILPGS